MHNTKLIEEFSQLEKLCNDIYGDKHGVTIYIDEMKQKRAIGSRRVVSWNSDLERLIDIRHKRNNLSHGNVSFDEPYATQEDILFITDFKRRILRQSDPLSMLEKIYSVSRGAQISNSKPTSKSDSFNLSGILLAFFMIIIGALIIYAVFSK